MVALAKLKDVAFDDATALEPQLVEIGVRIANATMSEDFINLARVVISRFIQAPEIAAKTMKDQDTFNESLIRWIKAACDNGKLSAADPTRAATEFTGLVKAFAFWPQLTLGEAPLAHDQLLNVVESSAAMFLSRYETKSN